MPYDTRDMQAGVMVDWALCLWYAGCVFMGDCGRLWEILRYCAFSKHLITSQNLSKPLITLSSTRADGMPHSVNIRYHPYLSVKNGVCSRQRFCLHEGIGNRSTVSSPHTPQPLRTHFPSGFSATVSSAVCAGGSVGRPTTASRSLSAAPCGLAWSVFPLHSRLMLGLPFALAKVILLACLALALDSTLQSRPARSHPCGARTRALNIPRKTSKMWRAFVFVVCVPHSVKKWLVQSALV